jgi:hypothetical protein
MRECKDSATILDLGTKWKWVVRFTLGSLYSLEKSPRYPLDRRLGGLQSRSRFCGVEKNRSPLPIIEHRPFSTKPVAMATELSWLDRRKDCEKSWGGLTLVLSTVICQGKFIRTFEFQKAQIDEEQNFVFVGWVRLSPLGTPATNGPIVPVPDDDDTCGAVGGMRTASGDRSARRKPTPVPHFPWQIPHDLTWDRNRTAEVRSRRLTA